MKLLPGADLFHGAAPPPFRSGRTAGPALRRQGGPAKTLHHGLKLWLDGTATDKTGHFVGTQGPGCVQNGLTYAGVGFLYVPPGVTGWTPTVPTAFPVAAQPFSLAFWCKPNNGWSSYGSGTADSNAFGFTTSSGLIAAEFSNPDGGAVCTFTADGMADSLTWYYAGPDVPYLFVLQADGAGSLFLDVNDGATSISTTTQTPSYGAESFTVGNFGLSVADWEIGNVMVWNRTLTAGEKSYLLAGKFPA